MALNTVFLWENSVSLGVLNFYILEAWDILQNTLLVKFQLCRFVTKRAVAFSFFFFFFANFPANFWLGLLDGNYLISGAHYPIGMERSG